MSFRAKAAIVPVIAAACLLLASCGSALARTSAQAGPAKPVEVTGKQLKTALLPASDFARGATATAENDSGSKLEPRGRLNIQSMRCGVFWSRVIQFNSGGRGPRFGETAYAANVIFPKGVNLDDQGAYQFASSRAAASFYGKMAAKFRACPLASWNDTGQPFQVKLVSLTKTRVGGHQAFQVVYSMPPGGSTPFRSYRLFAVDGAYVYNIGTTNTWFAGGPPPRPSPSSLALKLIARVRALR